MKTFLTTYQTFLPPQRLMINLLRRYDLHAHAHLAQPLPTRPRAGAVGAASGVPSIPDHPPMLPIQIRVCNVLRNWVDEFFPDFDKT